MAIEDLKPEIIRKQIRAVAEDFAIDAGKTGMLHTEEIIKTVSSEISKHEFPLVVDPVMIAKSGAQLLRPEAVSALKTYLLPKATVITPNKPEAEELTDMKIKSSKDIENAAKRISSMGSRAVVIKGGHLEGKESVDLLYYEGTFRTFKGPRLDVNTTHGTGCSFSAAITAGLARKMDIPAAVQKAKEIVTYGIRFGLNVGKGYGPVNPMAYLYRESARYAVLMNLEKAKDLIETAPEIAALVPEVGMNVAMAIPYAENVNDIAAIEGRIVRTTDGAKAVGNARFGCSSHLAKYILEIIKHDEKKRAAINLKFSDTALEILKSRNMVVSSYDRKKEPEKIKKIEGMTIPWGVKEAMKKVKKSPDAIYHRGDIGKEPMIVVFGEQAYDLVRFTVQLARRIAKK
jgi:hydroxymethylpyrimidine/phosphomethylpyrimidine kinase